MPKKETKPTVKLNDKCVNARARSLALHSKNRKMVEDVEKDAKAKLAESLEGYIAENGVAKFVTGNVTINVIEGTSNPRIDGERLLELGVSPEIVKQATIPGTPYYQYRVTVKEEEA